jgi:hypothetical protein
MRAAADPFGSFNGRAEKGHYVEVVAGEHKGTRGVITTDAKDDKPYKVTLSNGKVSGYLKPDQLKSSGLDEAAFNDSSSKHALKLHAKMRDACAQLSKATRDALAEIRRRVAHDELPLLSLLQAEPLQLQASHLSFQEYFAARALCEEGSKLTCPPPWQWPAWWANALSIGTEMGEPFGKGLLRAAGVEGTELNLKQKLGGDRPTALRAVSQMLVGLKTLE